jgi:hypothetical protein
MEVQKSQLYKVCSEYCTTHHDGNAVMTQIKRETTVEEFNTLLQSYPEYKIEHSGTSAGTHALSKAAVEGNVNLVKHIVKKLNGQKLLNTGDSGHRFQKSIGWTPLYLAGNCSNAELGYKISKILLEVGADPNISSNGNSRDRYYPPFSTPLYRAIEKTKNLKLVKLLLLYGAVVNPALSSEGEVFLARAKLELSEKSKRLKALLEYKG